MFLRKIVQRRQGQTYTYYALSETIRAPGGRVRQRTICYLGRLDHLRPPDWLRVAERLPDPAWLPRLMEEVGYTPPSTPGGPVRTVVIDPDSISWCRPRRLGDVYVGLRLAVAWPGPLAATAPGRHSDSGPVAHSRRHDRHQPPGGATQ